MKGLSTGIPAIDLNSGADWTGESPYFSRGGFVFDPASGLTYTMNHTGASIYEMLRAGPGAVDIVRALVERFEVEESVARADLEDFLQQMRLLGLQ